MKTDEEDNNLLFKIRAKLYRFNKTDEDEGEWKERGTGEVKLLQSKVSHKVQLVMRREKTHKVCALHLGNLINFWVNFYRRLCLYDLFF